MIKQVIKNCSHNTPWQHQYEEKIAEWGYIEGDINKQKDLVEYIDQHTPQDIYTKEEVDEKISVVQSDVDNVEQQLINTRDEFGRIADTQGEDIRQLKEADVQIYNSMGQAFNVLENMIMGKADTSYVNSKVQELDNKDVELESKIDTKVDQETLTIAMLAVDSKLADKADRTDIPDVSIFNPTDNFKTINGNSIIGTGDIEIQGGGGSYDDTELRNAIEEGQEVTAAALNDLNDRINDDADAVTAAALYDLNDRINNIHVDPYDDTELRGRIENVEDKVEDLQLYKFPNATIYGEPTINNGQISNFSTENYLQFPFIVDFKGRPFEIKMNFSVNNTSGQHNIFDSNFGLAYAVIDGHFVLAYSTNGTSWNLGAQTGSHDVQANTNYYIKIVSDGYNCTLKYSFDDNEYYDDIAISGGTPYPRQIIIGKSLDNRYVFDGIINFNNCLVTISDKVVWQGMDDAGIATRLAVDMSNIDEAGVNKIKELASSDMTKYLDKTYTGTNTLQGNIQIGDYTTNVKNAFLHVRNVGSSSITNYNVNGACFSVNSDGTASFQHKIYNDLGGNAKNSAVLRFSNKGIQFAINTSSGLSPTEAMYKELATEAYVDSKIGDIDTILTNIING